MHASMAALTLHLHPVGFVEQNRYGSLAYAPVYILGESGEACSHRDWTEAAVTSPLVVSMESWHSRLFECWLPDLAL
jgi:hypothetical protein